MENTHVNMNKFIELFNLAVVSNKSIMVDPVKLNETAMKLGYFVQPEAATKEVAEFISGRLRMNVNSTFYKNWLDVTSRTRFELFIDQVFHYMTTYGTGFALANGFVPNEIEGLENIEFDYSQYKVISAITPKGMFDKCIQMGMSGIALKNETSMLIGNYIYNFAIDNAIDVDIDAIKNRELRIRLYDLFGTSPKDKFELIRYMVYKATASAMIIKNDEILRLIKRNSNKFDFTTLSEYQIDGLASIFYRYKDIILMFKNECNSHVINVIRRKAVKLHKPMKIGFWESLITNKPDAEEVYNKSAELTNFKLVTLLQMLNEEMLVQADIMNAKKLYVVRNGKMFIKDAEPKNTYSLKSIYDALYKRLVENMSKKACTVKLPANLHIACPTSEKNYVGTLPFGSYFDMSENNIIGIYWRNEWGTRDFDLSMNDVNGNRIGWNSSYRTDNCDIVYSGDMTNAEPEATELLYAKQNCPNGSVYVNRYNGEDKSKYRFFFANECVAMQNMCNYMVNPDNIKVDVMLESNSTQQQLGFIANNRFYFMCLGNGNSIVARTRRNVTQEDIFNIYVRKGKTNLYLENVLKDAGFTFVTDAEETPELDLTTLQVDTLINLFDK